VIFSVGTVALTVALLVVVWGLSDGLAALELAQWPWLGVAVVFSIILNGLLGAHKWARSIALLGMEVPRRVIWRLWIGLLPVTFFAPFQSGHALYGVALWRATGTHPLRAAECVVYDKVATLVGSCLLVAIGQTLLPASSPAWNPLIALGCAAVVVLFLWDSALRRLLERAPLIRAHSTFATAGVSLRGRIELLILAAVYQSSDVITGILAARALGLDVDLWVVAGAMPLVMLLSYVPITISGFGARDLLAVVLLADVMGAEPATAIGFVINVVEYVVPALFGLVALRATVRVLRSAAPPAAVAPG
jgi:hypothetical protein